MAWISLQSFFELVTYRQMNQLAAYMGFPIRYPHWRWGMEYERVRKSYSLWASNHPRNGHQ